MERIEHAFRSYVRGWFVAAALVGLSLTAQAGTLSKSTLGAGVSYTTGVYRYGNDGASNVPGTWRPTTMTVPPGTAETTMGNWKFGADAAGPRVYTGHDLDIPGSGGRRLPVEMSAPVTKMNAAKAIGKFAASATRNMLGPIMTGVALFDLAQDLGFIPAWNDETDALELTKEEIIRQCQADCFEFRGMADDSLPWTVSQAQACQQWIDKHPGYGYYVAGMRFDKVTANCGIASTAYPQWGTSWQMIQFRSVPPYDVRETHPATIEELEDAIAAQSGWPTNATRALAQAVKDGGQSVEYGTPTVSGPASVAGPQTVTKEPVTKPGPDGTIVTGTKTGTTSTTYNNTYNTNNVTVKVTNSTTYVTNWSDGTTDTTEPTTKEEEAPKPEEEKGDECEKHPDRAGCADLDTPEGQIPREQVSLTYAAEDRFGGGSCPANKTMNLRGNIITVIDWVKWCDLTATYVRPLILLLATISAFFIVATGRDQGAA